MSSLTGQAQELRNAMLIGDQAGEVLDELIDRLERAQRSELWDVLYTGILLTPLRYARLDDARGLASEAHTDLTDYLDASRRLPIARDSELAPGLDALLETAATFFEGLVFTQVPQRCIQRSLLAAHATAEHLHALQVLLSKHAAELEARLEHGRHPLIDGFAPDAPH